MLALFKRYPQVLLFGILATMFSSPGQTFLVSLFIPHMRVELGVSQTAIAATYSIATVISALLMPFVGRLIDHMRLVTFGVMAGCLLALGCMLLSFSTTLLWAGIGFLLIRNLGQGALTMASSTTMARVFGRVRGKALSVASLGYPLGEAIFPIVVSTWILFYDWRSGWQLLSALVVLGFTPIIFFLTRRDPDKRAHAELLNSDAKEGESHAVHSGRDFTVRQMLRDWRFYAIVSALYLPPGILTALFFHQGSLVIWKGWDLTVTSTAFLAFAVGRGSLAFFIGPFIDRFSAKCLIPMSMLPLAIGLTGFLFGKQVGWMFFYLAGAGMTTGMGMTASAALWAELYGTRYLGSIRGVQASLVIFSTAVAPPLVGYCLDRAINPEIVLSVMIALLLFGSFMLWFVSHRTMLRENALRALVGEEQV